MHPADLAAHRAQRQQHAVRHLERDAHRLAPRIPPTARVALRAALDQARNDGPHAIEQLHGEVRQWLSRLDRQAAA